MKLTGLIAASDGIHGGDPCIADTRLRTRDIAYCAAHKYAREGDRTIRGVAMVQRLYPYLTTDQIEAAIEWERESPTMPRSWEEASPDERAVLLGYLEGCGPDDTMTVRLLRLAITYLEQSE